EVDVLLRILGREQQDLGADLVRVLVANLRAQPDDAVLQQLIEDTLCHEGFRHSHSIRCGVDMTLPAAFAPAARVRRGHSPGPVQTTRGPSRTATAPSCSRLTWP